MNQRITLDMLETKFATFERAAREARLIPDGWVLTLEHGNAYAPWRVMLMSDSVDRRRQTFSAMPNGGHMGKSKGQAWDTLDAVWHVLMAVNERDRKERLTRERFS